MIIVISNRKVDESRIGADGLADEEFFGEELAGNEGATTRMAVADYKLEEDDYTDDEDTYHYEAVRKPKYNWELEPVAEGQERSRLESLLGQLDHKQMKKWVFFLHGNNQTTRKNLEKCREIVQLHDVNVIAFSWPSYGKIFSQNMFAVLLPIIMKNGGLNYKVLMALLGKGIEGKQKAYNKAVSNARSSRIALHNTLAMVSDAFSSSARQVHDNNFKFSLLVHSLGNRVLEYMIKDNSLSELSPMFDNVVLHQADVSANGHEEWVPNVRLGERKYITHNKYDWVLHVSDVFGDNDRRLGHVDGENACSHEHVDAYIDFTKGRNVRVEHGLFRVSDGTNEKINDCFNALLSGEEMFVGERLPLGFEGGGNRYAMKPDYQHVGEKESDTWGYVS